VKSQLYVPEITRRYLKKKIQSFVKIYFQKLLPVFNILRRKIGVAGDINPVCFKPASFPYIWYNLSL